MIHDISPPLSAKTAHWPGDVPFARKIMTDIAKGDTATGSSLELSAHCGAHIDAPAHVRNGAATVDRLDLATYVGSCQVIRVDVPRGQQVVPEMLSDAITAPRLLIATGTRPDPTAFNEDFAGLSAELADALHAADVFLVGIDTPSVDLYTQPTLPAHHRLIDHNIAILEGLVLDDVAPGRYELIALPLYIADGDGSPVRAVLRESA